jgi:hypothetical protein
VLIFIIPILRFLGYLEDHIYNENIEVSIITFLSFLILYISNIFYIKKIKENDIIKHKENEDARKTGSRIFI